MATVTSYKADVSSVSPSSELYNSLRWPIYIFNLVDITKLPCYPHRCSTTVSLETFTLYSFVSSPMCPVIFCRHVLFGFSRDELRATPHIFVYILNLCKLTIWQSRNDYRFRGIPPDTVSAIVKVKTRVKFNLPLFFKRFRSARRQSYFHRQWGARGVVASVAAGQLSVNI